MNDKLCRRYRKNDISSRKKRENSKEKLVNNNKNVFMSKLFSVFLFFIIAFLFDEWSKSKEQRRQWKNKSLFIVYSSIFQRSVFLQNMWKIREIWLYKKSMGKQLDRAKVKGKQVKSFEKSLLLWSRKQCERRSDKLVFSCLFASNVCWHTCRLKPFGHWRYFKWTFRLRNGGNKTRLISGGTKLRLIFGSRLINLCSI